MTVIELEMLEAGGANVPITEIESLEDFFPNLELGASRWRYSYSNGCHLDSLLVNKGKDVLVVSFHGALNRNSYQIPRFERLATLLPMDVSSMYFSDPSLWKDETLQLSWFTGWDGLDLFSQMAQMIHSAAESLGVKKIILSGSSGGGFAALQVAPLIKDSVSLVFNPQTHIHGYYDDGKPTTHGAERKFIEVVYPEAAPNGIWKIDFGTDWTEKYGAKLSAVRRYTQSVQNWVVYANNENDWHVEQHFEPFREACAVGGNLDRLKEFSYAGKTGHFPPTPAEFRAGLDVALDWPEKIPPISDSAN